jgi:uncharacterized membrane protein YbhN (UPF0104 family)
VSSQAGAIEPANPDTSPRISSRAVLQGIGVAAAVTLLGTMARQVDFGRVALLLRGLGPLAVLLIAPSMAAVGLETFAWQRAFSRVGSRPAFWSLLRVRVASESLGVALPLGAVFADAIKPRLLSQRCSTPVSVNIVGVAARKYLLVLSQGAYLLLGFALGRTLLCAAFERACGTSALAVLALVGAIVLFLLAEGMALSLRGGATFRALIELAGRFPSSWLRSRLAQWKDEMARTDTTAALFFGAAPSVRLALAAPCLGGWLFEATETWTILHVLGAHLSWGDAVGVEALVVLARNVLAILPGGLGAQELGYATLLAGAGVDLGVSAAMMVLKRLRELSWALIGGALLAESSLARKAAELPDV